MPVPLVISGNCRLWGTVLFALLVVWELVRWRQVGRADQVFFFKEACRNNQWKQSVEAISRYSCNILTRPSMNFEIKTTVRERQWQFWPPLSTFNHLQLFYLYCAVNHKLVGNETFLHSSVDSVVHSLERLNEVVKRTQGYVETSLDKVSRDYKWNSTKDKRSRWHWWCPLISREPNVDLSSGGPNCIINSRAPWGMCRIIATTITVMIDCQAEAG